MCTSIVAGKKATIDNVILVSRNEDFPSNNCWNKYMVYRDQPEYVNSMVTKNGLWTLGNGLVIPIPEKKYRYNAVPDAMGYEESNIAIGNRYLFEERGINEKGVAISATNSLAINKQANKADPLLTEGGIAESVIPTILLPQAESALDGVKLLGHYVETSGAGEVNGILFGDSKEAWYFENGSAHHWIAVRVPDDMYIAVSNSMRVHDVNLDDKKNVLTSKGLFEFVKKTNLLKNPDRNKFDFAKAFGILGVPANTDRLWLAQKILTPSKKQNPRLDQYPLFLKPDKKIGVTDVMGVLRATYKGTILDGKPKANRPIGVPYTAESHIMTVDGKMPKELQGMIWQVISSPMGAPYMPLFSVMDEIPAGYSLGNTTYDTISAYWAFKGLYSLAATHKQGDLVKLRKSWADYEEQSLKEVESLKGELKRMYQKDKNSAIQYAKRYSFGIAAGTQEDANRKRNALITEITQAIVPSKKP